MQLKLLKNENILLLGSTGLAGYAIKNELKKNKISFLSPSRTEINLFKIEEIIDYLKEKEITMLINAAAKVGGIYANIKNPIDFYYENSVIQDNIIYASVKNNIKKIVFLSSACIYPENNDIIPDFYSNDMSYQNLHKTNLGYTLAKKNHIDVLKMTYEKYDIKFLYLIISNMFGINDNFSDESSHFIPIVMKKLHQAKIEKRKELNLFAVKNIYREFMFNEDFAFNFINLLNVFSFENDYMNFGSGMEYDLYDLIFKINDIVKFKGEIIIKEPETIGNKKRIMNLDFLKSKINIYNTDINKCLKKTYKFHFHK
jgi:GDP-L-fucose synthase